VGSVGVVSLANGVLRTMMLFRLKLAAATVLGLGVLGMTVGVAYQTRDRGTEEQQPVAPVARPGAADALKKAVLADVPALHDGPLTVIGTEVLPDENVPEGRRLSARVGFLAIAIRPGENVPPGEQIRFPGNARVYRRWHDGDSLGDPGEAD